MLSLLSPLERPQSEIPRAGNTFVVRFGTALLTTYFAALIVDTVHIALLRPALPLIFAVAVAASGWVGGLAPALISAVLSGVALARHDGTLQSPHWADLFRLGCLIFIATAVAWLRRRADVEREQRLALDWQIANMSERLTVQQQLYGETVQTMQQEKRRTLLLRSLAEASLRIHSANSIDSVLKEITDQAREIIGAHQAFTSLTQSGNWTQAVHAVSLSKKYAEQPPDAAARQAYQGFLGNYAHAANWSDGSDWIAAPLVTRDGRNLGIIQVLEKIDGSFTDEDRSILVQLAHMASVAIDNVRLYRESQEQVSERDRAQELLEHSRATLVLAQAAAEMGVFDWNLQTGELNWPREMCMLHGLERFDGRYQSWLAAVHPEDRNRVHDAITHALAPDPERRNGNYRVEYRNLRPDSSMHWIEVRGRVFSAGGRPLRLLGVAMDVTLRKRSEDVLRTSEKLAATGRLAASIAHEINNPLSAVTNVLYLLGQNHELDPSAREHVALAEAELQRVIHITRQSLAFYRESTHPVVISTANIWEEVLRVYANTIAKREVRIEKDYRGECSILAFPGELRQVFSNLLLNALEATAPGGTVRIRVREAAHVNNGIGRGVRVTVSDSGSGISPEHRARLFEPFFSTKGEKGTGLGLWVTEGIVKKHGGSIRVRSRADSEHRGGTSFSLFLPAAAAGSSSQNDEDGRSIEAVA